VTPTVFVLVLLSASLHVVWNALVKKANNKASFAWLATVVAAGALLPAFAALRLWRPGPLGARVWTWAALSGLFEAAYTVLLFEAYRKADLSVVYPLSRGVAPLATLAVASRLVGDTVTPTSAAAVVVVVAGVAAVSFSTRGGARPLARALGVVFALAAGAMIAGYHLVDRHAMNRPDRPGVVEYLFLMHLFLGGFVTAWVVLRPRLRAGAWDAWRTSRRAVLVVGVLNPLAYLLVVLALAQEGANVTYVAAGRNVGIVLSAVFGVLLLKERVGLLRAVGAALIALGVAALVLVGRAG
jgi:drug/metabolite transporter (DMT)-like permease